MSNKVKHLFLKCQKMSLQSIWHFLILYLYLFDIIWFSIDNFWHLIFYWHFLIYFDFFLYFLTFYDFPWHFLTFYVSFHTPNLNDIFWYAIWQNLIKLSNNVKRACKILKNCRFWHFFWYSESSSVTCKDVLVWPLCIW